MLLRHIFHCIMLLSQHIENKVITRLDASIRQQHDDVSKLKRDTRDGFSTVHESISNMKTVMEGKRKLLEDQLRKEISQIRKMVVLVWYYYHTFVLFVLFPKSNNAIEPAPYIPILCYVITKRMQLDPLSLVTTLKRLRIKLCLNLLAI